MHIFPYSRRPGTPAADMAGQIPKVVQEERVHRAMEAAEEMKEAYLENMVGQTVSVLFEEERDGLWQGHTPSYVLAHGKGKDLHNKVRQVRITGVVNGGLLGEVEQ